MAKAIKPRFKKGQKVFILSKVTTVDLPIMECKITNIN